MVGKVKKTGCATAVKRMTRTAAVVFLLFLTPLFYACNNGEIEKNRIVGAVDSVDGYQPVALTAAQSGITRNCKIKALYLNGMKQVYYTNTKGYGGILGLSVLVDENIIQKIVVVDDRETSDIGGNCYSDAYLSNYTGIDILEITQRNPPELIGGSRSESGADIIYYTGATTTSKALLAAVNGIISFRNLHGNLIFDFGNAK